MSSLTYAKSLTLGGGRKAYDPTPTNSDGIDRSVRTFLDALETVTGDPPFKTGFDLSNELQSIAIHTGTPTAGTFTLTIEMLGVPAFTTAAIAYDANAATIEGAIDTAATTASFPGWTNGDITVAGGPLTTTPVTLTCDGASVDESFFILTTAADSITGGTPGAITRTQRGQRVRTGWQILELVGAIATIPPNQGEITPIVAGGGSKTTFDRYPRDHVLRRLCEEANAEDGNPTGLLDALLSAVGLE